MRDDVCGSGYCRAVPRGQPDIANTALRIFLQDLGAAYDLERGKPPYKGGKHFQKIKEFFGSRCCYCGVEFSSAAPANQDRLIPINKLDLGLHAWGNIVPACQACNNARQRKDWRDYILERAGTNTSERHARVRAYLKEYDYDPKLGLKDVAEELYVEVGEIAVTLIRTKMKRLSDKL